jgi:hypothetical protein
VDRDQLETPMTTTYTDIEEKQETLAQLSGAKDYSADDVKNWRDRARSAKQGNVGMKWKYMPKNPTAPQAGKRKDPTESQQFKPEMKHVDQSVPSSSFSITDEATVDCSQAFNEEGA